MADGLNDDIRVSDVQPLLEYPSWLQVRMSSKLTKRGRELADTLTRAVILIAARAEPSSVTLRFDVLESGALSIRYFSSPRVGDVVDALLNQLIAQCEELHNRTTVSSREQEQTRESRELPCFLTDDYDAEFDWALHMGECQSATSVDVFQFSADIDQLANRVKGRDGDTQRRTSDTLDRLARSGISRRLADPSPDWQTQLTRMIELYPNFSEVLQNVVQPHVALRARGLPHRLAPILLVGTPGIGKTRFANALATLLGVPPPLFVSIATETNGSSLAGSSTFWSNSSPGLLFESIAWGSDGHSPVANGLVVLDEVDKPNRGEYSSLGALYSLLEEHTAKRYVDQALPDVAFDASHVRVISTANDLDQVPVPLKSRMLIFQIGDPSPSQLKAIAREVLGELVQKLGIPFSLDLPGECASDFENMSPRSIKMNLEIALARAVVEGRDRLVAADWPGIASPVSTRSRRPMGFVQG